MKLSLQTKMGLSFLIGLLILLIVGFTAWQANTIQIENSNLVSHTHQVLTHAEGLLNSLTEAESATRGYAISGDEEFIKPYQAITEDIEFEYRSLLTLTDDNPEQQQRLFTIKPLIDQRLSFLATLNQIRRQAGLASVQERFINGRGKQLQDAIHKQIDDLEYTEEKLLVLRTADTESAIKHARLAIILGTLCASLLTIASFIVIRHDIERRTAAENALKIANNKLAQATERAQHADSSKSAFLATMSHELRTPLNSIIGFSGVLLQELAGPLNMEQKKQLGMVRDSSRHLLALVNDVLDISKVEAGQLRIQHQTFSVREAIDRSVALVMPLASKKGLSIEVQIDTDLGEIITDRRRVEQVLINLLTNATKFTEQGSVTLHADTLNDYQPPGASASQPAIRIRVTDTGIGIDDSDLPELFQPFRQIEDGLARQHEGTGLGLAISHRLLSLMGGRIDVVSKKNEGSTFTVIIPRHGIEPL
ncbi:MAG TPA: CHASE3 domain-containing protein [Herbaspirillum sp.]|nr:CHASE3 domain-containing protein [Herbaspirillum sp.]